MCVIRYAHSCGHIRENIYGTKLNPNEMCLCGRIYTQDCTDASCEHEVCSFYPANLDPIASTFDAQPMPDTQLTLEEQLAVLDAERHQLNLNQSRIGRDVAQAEEAVRMLEVEAQMVSSRYADGEWESLEGQEARKRVTDKMETAAIESRLNRLRAEISKMKIHENEAEIRRVRETIDEVYNEALDRKMENDQMEFEGMLAEDMEDYVEMNKEVARRAREEVRRDIQARQA